MVRRTKEEALATRHSILDAAELLFEKRGSRKANPNGLRRCLPPRKLWFDTAVLRSA